MHEGEREGLQGAIVEVLGDGAPCLLLRVHQPVDQPLLFRRPLLELSGEGGAFALARVAGCGHAVEGEVEHGARNCDITESLDGGDPVFALGGNGHLQQGVAGQ